MSLPPGLRNVCSFKGQILFPFFALDISSTWNTYFCVIYLTAILGVLRQILPSPRDGMWPRLAHALNDSSSIHMGSFQCDLHHTLKLFCFFICLLISLLLTYHHLIPPLENKYQCLFENKHQELFW